VVQDIYVFEKYSFSSSDTTKTLKIDSRHSAFLDIVFTFFTKNARRKAHTVQFSLADFKFLVFYAYCYLCDILL